MRSCRPVSRSHTFEHQYFLLEVAQDLAKAGVVGYLEFLGEHVQDTGDLSGVQALDRQMRTAGLVRPFQKNKGPFPRYGSMGVWEYGRVGEK